MLDPKPIAGGPASRWSGKSGAVGAVHGYMTLVVHPRFAENHWIYFSYSKPPDGDKRAAGVARAVLKDGKLTRRARGLRERRVARRHQPSP